MTIRIFRAPDGARRAGEVVPTNCTHITTITAEEPIDPIKLALDGYEAGLRQGGEMTTRPVSASMS